MDDTKDLRDHFAGVAMAALISSVSHPQLTKEQDENQVRLWEESHGKGLTIGEYIAKEAYQFADTMIQER